jgi:hypothetical protein
MTSDVDHFYNLLRSLKQSCCRRLGLDDWTEVKLCNCSGMMPYWQDCQRGIYLFFDENEVRADGEELRVVMVGAHAVKKTGGKATLWERLKQHRGIIRTGGGYHRKSVFRLLVGEAMNNLTDPEKRVATWGKVDMGVREDEHRLEMKVSNYIRNLPFVFMRVDPESDGREHIHENDRMYLKQNIIALLSNINRGEGGDMPSSEWLGNHSGREKVRASGLWNNEWVDKDYNPIFLEIFEHYLRKM